MSAELIDRMYEASFAPDLWPGILNDLAAMTDSRGGLLLSTREKTLNWTASDSVHGDFDEYLQGGWFRRCGRRVCLLEKAHSAFLTELDYWTEDELQNNDIYRDFFYPRDLGWSAGTGLVMPTGDHIVVSVERARERGPIEASFVNTLNELRPHLARAAMIAARMGLQTASTARDAFAKLNIPVVLLDLNGTGVDCSSEADRLSDALVWGANERLALKDGDANELFQAALAALDKRSMVQSFPVKDDAGRPTHVAHVVPVSGSAHDIFAKGYALLVFNPLDGKARPSLDLLRSLFDLTAAEANVARELGAGASVETIAENGGVSINTVRTQVRKIMEKTGCKRTPEVVSLISNLSLSR
jgi:DNA-binding CsgD family transcriptional regulator